MNEKQKRKRREALEKLTRLYNTIGHTGLPPVIVPAQQGHDEQDQQDDQGGLHREDEEAT